MFYWYKHVISQNDFYLFNRHIDNKHKAGYTMKVEFTFFPQDSNLVILTCSEWELWYQTFCLCYQLSDKRKNVHIDILILHHPFLNCYK